MDYKLLGEILKTAREKNKCTQKYIADILNVTPQNVSSWERGKSKIDIETLLILCDRYQLSFANTLEKVAGELREQSKISSSNTNVPKEEIQKDAMEIYNIVNKYALENNIPIERIEKAMKILSILLFED